jgi:metal-sulfur cluster biosynthetic enzyme
VLLRRLSSIDTAAKREAEVLRALEQVVEPATGMDVVSLGAVQALNVTDGAVRFSLDLLVNGHPDAAQVNSVAFLPVRSALEYGRNPL